jgi:hypothetical protein
MKQLKPFWAILTSIAVVFAVVLLPQCTPKSPPCNLPAPRTVRVDSFLSNGQAYISWTQVVGNNGYRIRVVEVDSPPSVTALRDTSVGINDTNIVITNLPVNTLLEFQVYAKCANDSSSTNYGSDIHTKIVIIDECPLLDGEGILPSKKKPCDTLTRDASQKVEMSKAGVNFYTINRFIQKPKLQYRVKVMDGVKVMTDILLIAKPTVYYKCSDCGENPPKKTDFNVKTRTFEWKEPKGSNKIRLIIDDKTNSLIIQTDKKRQYIIERSIKYGRSQ